jgi:hypothetical protein
MSPREEAKLKEIRKSLSEIQGSTYPVEEFLVLTQAHHPNGLRCESGVMLNASGLRVAEMLVALMRKYPVLTLDVLTAVTNALKQVLPEREWNLYGDEIIEKFRSASGPLISHLNRNGINTDKVMEELRH